LLLSLLQRWMTMLVAKLDQPAHEDIPAEKARQTWWPRSPDCTRWWGSRPGGRCGCGPCLEASTGPWNSSIDEQSADRC